MKPFAAAVLCLGMIATAGTAHAGAEEKCVTCHHFTDQSKVGPGLAGVVGRQAGAVAGFKYGPAMAAQGWSWTEENLTTLLTEGAVKGVVTLSGDAGAKTKMRMPPMSGAETAEVIAFLKGLK